MKRFTLDKYQIHSLISDNLYQIEENSRLMSRCIDGRYPNIDSLPALAMPGADIGQLAVIMSTANTYGFEIDLERAYQSFVEVIGGEKNFQFHTHCGYYDQIQIDPKAYNLEVDQLIFIKEKLELLKKLGVQEFLLSGDHNEGAVVQIRGDYGLYPQFEIDGPTSTFVYHQTLINARHRLIAQKLINKKVIKFFADFDEIYLYEALSEVVDDHFFETLKRLAIGLPIYSAIINNKDDIKVEEMGKT
jgi:hypothetical protein